jgi:hypothetical protein
VLKEAWKRVKKNNGSPGIDGISIDSFDNEPRIDGVTITKVGVKISATCNQLIDNA